MSGENTRHENDLSELETRLLSAFQDPPSDADVMARSYRRLRETMAGGVKPARRGTAAVLGPIAATVVLLIVAGVISWRLTAERVTPQGGVKPSATAKLVPTADLVDPLSCRLPVLVTLDAGPPGQMRQEVGFVETRSGQYSRDGSAAVAGLPGGGSPGVTNKKNSAQPASPSWYSASLGRWLPVFRQDVSPDGRSYLWVRLLPEGSLLGPNFQKAELHRYDVVSATDRTLWAYPGSIDVFRWDASGILVNTVPPAGGIELWWLVDPQTGSAAQQEIAPGPSPRLIQLPGDPLENGTFVYSGWPFGADFQGHTLYRIGSRDPGAPEWVVYETAPGQRVAIYRGRQGDATGFDPSDAQSDATGIWFGDYSGKVLWRWQPGSGLHKLSLAGLPSPIAGPSNSYVLVDPAGQCN